MDITPIKVSADLSDGLNKLLTTVNEVIGLPLPLLKVKFEGWSSIVQAKGQLKAIESVLKSEGLPENKEAVLEKMFDSRIAQRIVSAEERKQKNIDEVVSKSAKYVPEEVSPEPVDQDWLDAFFRDVQIVSEQQMQEIYAKVLAGEIASPGTCGKKTLRVLHDMSRREAECFRAVSPLVERFHGVVLLPYPHLNNPDFLESFGLDQKALMVLAEAGLILLDDSVSIIFDLGKNELAWGHPLRRIAFEAKLHGHGKAHSSSLISPVINVTQACQELISVVGVEPNIRFVQETFHRWQSQIEILSDPAELLNS